MIERKRLPVPDDAASDITLTDRNLLMHLNYEKNSPLNFSFKVIVVRELMRRGWWSGAYLIHELNDSG